MIPERFPLPGPRPVARSRRGPLFFLAYPLKVRHNARRVRRGCDSARDTSAARHPKLERRSSHVRASTEAGTGAAALAVVPWLCLSTLSPVALLSTSGQVQIIAAPPSVREGALESDVVARVFAERLGFVLPTDLVTDITAPGAYDTVAGLTPGVLPAGTVVDSFFLHADRVGSPGAAARYVGSVTFDVDILGLMVQVPALRASDAVLGAPGTLYSTSPTVDDLELDPAAPERDSVVLSADRRTLMFDFRTTVSTDTVRIVTAAGAVPEPAGALLLGLGALGLLGYAWHRRVRGHRV